MEFLIGFLVGQLFVSGVRLPGPSMILCGCALYALGSIPLVPEEYRYAFLTEEFRYFFRGAPLGLVVIGLLGVEQRGWLPRIPGLNFLGDASYSIYLLHYVPIILAWMIVPKDSFWIVTATGGVALGCAAYVLIERPLLRAMRPRPAPA